MPSRRSVTLKQLTCPKALQAYRMADYYLRHNVKACGWSEEKRIAYRLRKVFDAIKLELPE